MGSEPTLPLSRRERQVLDALFSLGEGTVHEVAEHLPDAPSYSAVRGTLRVLGEKGHVDHRWDGPRYLYRPRAAKESARSAALRHLVRTFFDGSVEAAAAALLGMRQSPTEEDLRSFEERVKAAEEEGR